MTVWHTLCRSHVHIRLQLLWIMAIGPPKTLPSGCHPPQLALEWRKLWAIPQIHDVLHQLSEHLPITHVAATVRNVVAAMVQWWQRKQPTRSITANPTYCINAHIHSWNQGDSNFVHNIRRIGGQTWTQFAANQHIHCNANAVFLGNKLHTPPQSSLQKQNPNKTGVLCCYLISKNIEHNITEHWQVMNKEPTPNGGSTHGNEFWKIQMTAKLCPFSPPQKQMEMPWPTMICAQNSTSNKTQWRKWYVVQKVPKMRHFRSTKREQTHENSPKLTAMQILEINNNIWSNHGKWRVGICIQFLRATWWTRKGKNLQAWNPMYSVMKPQNTW